MRYYEGNKRWKQRSTLRIFIKDEHKDEKNYEHKDEYKDQNNHFIEKASSFKKSSNLLYRSIFDTNFDLMN